MWSFWMSSSYPFSDPWGQLRKGNGCQTVASMSVTWRVCSNPEGWAPPPELYNIYIYIYIYIFWLHWVFKAARRLIVSLGLSCHSVGDLSSLTRDRTCIPLHWKADSSPPDHQGSPHLQNFWIHGYGVGPKNAFLRHSQVLLLLV